jgi:hypothetical protein
MAKNLLCRRYRWGEFEGGERLEGSTGTLWWCADGGSGQREQLSKNYEPIKFVCDCLACVYPKFSQLEYWMTTAWLGLDFTLISKSTRAWKLHTMTTTWLLVDFQQTLPDYSRTIAWLYLNFRFYWVSQATLTWTFQVFRQVSQQAVNSHMSASQNK